MLLLLLITIAAITFANIRSSIRANRDAELTRLEQIIELVRSTRFPLTSSVLENMKSLSGAEFLLTGGSGAPVAKTSFAPDQPPTDLENEGGAEKATINGGTFYHALVNNVLDPSSVSRTSKLHILFPRQSEVSIWWQASKSPLLIATLVLPLAFLFSLAMANQVTRPIANLNDQVQEIAQGNLKQITPLQGSDEIRELNESINEMATKLQDHDIQLRKNERLRTMVQFGSSIAHHLRNSATGCKMAVELLSADHQGIANSDNYQVAIRQLGLMNNYIKKFLLLSKSPDAEQHTVAQRVQLAPILENVVFLLSPSAKHLNVELTVQSDCDDTEIGLPEDDAEQLMMNLITNAITAASQKSANENPPQKAFVAIELVAKRGHNRFTVTDNGAGPPEEIADTIFQPFITGSKEGTGLGLSLVQEVSERVNGTVGWKRENGCTTFLFESPKSTTLDDE